MKKIFWLTNLLLLIFFILVGLFLWFRETDGTASLQTFNSRMLTILVWLGFYLLILLCQYLFILVKKGLKDVR
ncbi:DUF3923 family protein [Streptococcus didelphis]|nr:DUF3923 family protein [Streptococcus didelphis]